VDALILLHSVAALVLAAYALHQALLLAVFTRSNRHRGQPPPPLSSDALPPVTVQLPLFNERFMARRAIAAVLAQDYPRDKLQLQILDDSTDDTAAITRQCAQEAQQAGYSVVWIHRAQRNGYKAGALANGMAAGTHPFIAIFDADFVPKPDFLRRVFAHCAFEDAQTGFVQTRWDYLNRDESAITRGQALVLDVHFVIEQSARSSSGLPLAFNGSGGIWRRECIEAAGGWQADTLTEDLDLSYRARMLGWRGVYLAAEGAPGELPHDVLSYKKQQARWAAGTLQTVRKLSRALIGSHLPLLHRMAGLLHLTGYFIHPLILLMTLSTPLLLWQSLANAGYTPAWVNLVSILGAAPIISMAVASATRKHGIGRFLRDLPLALLLGIGVSFSNTLAMTRALLRRESGEFVRTPKSGSAPSAYTHHPDWTLAIEVVLTLYTLAAMVALWHVGHAWVAAPIALYALGFGGVAFNQLQTLLTAHSKR
jgi:cellulose synthase/poly-beta-1,6-N-acetylglucosamine synthase-like glycosyltransferase